MNQHYVPRAYLKNFAIRKGKGYFVDVFDQKLNRYFNSNITNVCSEIDFYTLDETSPHGSDKLIIEKIYANGFEPLFLKSYDILTNNKVFHITHLQRLEMLIGLFQLYMRNPKWINRSVKVHRNEILKLCEESRCKGKKGITYLNEDYSFKEWNEEAIIQNVTEAVTKLFKEEHINGIGEIGNFHEHAIIEVAVIRDNDDSEFITSDNPFIAEDQLDKDNYHPLSKAKEFFLALNRKMALRLYHDKSKSNTKIYRHYIPNGSVSMFNNKIVKQSSRFLILSKKQFERDNDFGNRIADNTSLDLKIGLMRQILANVPITADNNESHELIRYYLNLYDKNGGLSLQEEGEMYAKIEQQKRDFIDKRI